MTWEDVPQVVDIFGMLYRIRKVRTRQEIDALRILTNKGKRKFVDFCDQRVPSHESAVIAKVDVERLMRGFSPAQRDALLDPDLSQIRIRVKRCRALKRLRRMVA